MSKRTYEIQWTETASRSMSISETALAEMLHLTVAELRKHVKDGSLDEVLPDSLYDDLADLDDEADYQVERDGFEVSR